MELKASRSVIVRKLDQLNQQKTTQSIEQEIHRCNKWAKLSEVYKFNNSNIMKIVFTSSDMAERCLSSGLFMFQLYLSASDMNKDAFKKITICYRCYALNEHEARNCPKSESYLICSKCSGTGHRWNDCSATENKCINCGEQHVTMSGVCSARK